MTADLLLGLDGGTGGLRAFVFDRAGQVVSSGQAAYETAYPAPGWAEQRPADWLSAAAQAVREAVREIDPRRIAALAAAATSCTVCCCDGEGSALADALLWMDVRSGAEKRFIEERTGQRLSAETFICKALWLKRNRPALWKETRVLCEYQDVLNHFLTGEWVFSANTACNWGYDARCGAFHADFYEAIGLEDALGKVPQRCARAGEVIGALTVEAAKALGLPAGIPVVQGGIDSSVGMLGMGVARPGALALMTGSSNLLMAVTRQPLFVPEMAVNAGPDFLLPGYYTSVVGQAATGSILRWFRRELAREMGEDALTRLDAEAEQVPAGSRGVAVLDTWQGRRYPQDDPDARGKIVGLSMNTTRAELFRATMEGVACGTRTLIDAFQKKGHPIEAVHISGGTVRSRLFTQIHADICGVPHRVTSDHAVALGAAVLAAVALGWAADIPAAAEAMVRYARVVQPNAANREACEAIYARYLRMAASDEID